MPTAKHRLAYIAALVALVLPGGSVLVGVVWLYRYLRVQASD
jgi:hypothetical protein